MLHVHLVERKGTCCFGVYHYGVALFIGLGVGIAIQPPVAWYQWFVVFIYYVHPLSYSWLDNACFV